ncbi:hypothetical protein U9M48_005407 [Paspalum notatum var. saurae]|uniref:Uncharacterized protein n=1 Tax=Paspalum notatum var. saurae TaxID=547442 RepID=A0AAQ3PQ54_PASNO
MTILTPSLHMVMASSSEQGCVGHGWVALASSTVRSAIMHDGLVVEQPLELGRDLVGLLGRAVDPIPMKDLFTDTRRSLHLGRAGAAVRTRLSSLLIA